MYTGEPATIVSPSTATEVPSKSWYCDADVTSVGLMSASCAHDCAWVVVKKKERERSKSTMVGISRGPCFLQSVGIIS